MTHTVQILSLGATGDGLANINDKNAYVSGALSGEVVKAEVIAPRSGGLACKVIEVLEPSENRQTPQCKHFAQCGGCHMQHMKEGAYRSWKLEMVQKKMNRAEIDTEITPLLWEAPHSRKRATFHLSRKNGEIKLGFFGEYSNELVDISQCHAVHPKLFEAAMHLKQQAEGLLKAVKKCSVLLTLAHNEMVDAAFIISKKSSNRVETELKEIYQICGFTRVSAKCAEEDDFTDITLDHTPLLSYEDVSVKIPSGTFLQATDSAERAIQKTVKTSLNGCTNIADLFCGTGTFTLPFVSGGTRLTSIDISHDSVRALSEGTAGKNVKTQIRNLFTHPVKKEDLNGFDGIVIDPPRAGAKEQCVEIAKSNVQNVAMISCDVNSFVRDAKILIDGGYKIKSAKLVDQFIWSAHVEIISVYEK